MRLIDAESLCNSFELSDFNGDSNDNLNNACYIVSSMPTVEAVPMSIIEDIKAEIKTEISDYEGCADFYEGIRIGLRTAFEIIDKHIAGKESEDKE